MQNIKMIFIQILFIIGFSNILFGAMNNNWTPIMMGDITTFIPYKQTNTLRTLKNVYKPNEIVSVKVDAALSGDQDWVGVYPKYAVSNWENAVAWNWIPYNGTFALSEIKKAMPVGTYEARLFFHNNFELKASYTFSTIAAMNRLFPDDVLYQSIQTPNNVAFPNLGESVIDNSVPNPIQITRITEPYYYKDGNGDQKVWYPTHDYPKIQVWNVDQTLFRIRSWKILDATNYQEVRNISGKDIYPSYWSNTNPDLIWNFNKNGDIKKYTVSTDTVETIATIQGYEFVQLGPGEGNIDKNDHYVALVGKKANGDLDVIIFDLQAEKVVRTKTFAGAWSDGAINFPKYIDWVSVSQSGNYVVIMWNHNVTSENNPYNGHYGVEVYNREDMVYLNRLVSYGNHGDLGYAINGDEVFVQFYGHGGTLHMYKLDGSGSTVLSTHSDFGKAGHVSCRNLNRPGWAYISHSLPAQSGQLVAVKLDGSGLVEHFGHHFSSATSYAQSAMPVASPNGDKICFKSDFGTGPNTNPSVAYIFISNVKAP